MTVHHPQHPVVRLGDLVDLGRQEDDLADLRQRQGVGLAFQLEAEQGDQVLVLSGDLGLEAEHGLPAAH